jgi:hypothetical protein
MANDGTGGLVSGSKYISQDASEVFIMAGDTIPDKPDDPAAVETMLDGVKAVNTVLINEAMAAADDGKGFKLSTQASTYIVYADLGGLGAKRADVISANPNADYYIGVPFEDLDAVGVFALSIKDTINADAYAKEEVLCTFDTATVTITALKGGLCDDAVDIDLATIATVGNTTPGEGDWDNCTKTNADQAINTEPVDSYNTGDLEEIQLTEKLTVDYKMGNFLAKNYTVAKAKYNKKECIVAFYDRNGLTKRLEFAKVTMNVSKANIDKVYHVTFLGTKTATDIDGFNVIYDMVV